MINERFDYTKRRKGTRIPIDGVIIYCPRCGRKGAYRRRHQPIGTVVAEISHGGYFEPVAGGLLFRNIDDYCSLNAEEDAKVTA